jgi:hypothetical protein
MIAASLAPTAINAFANIVGSKPSPYERKLSKYATMFEEEGAKPITENRSFKSGMKTVEQYDKRNRKAINNKSAASGATDEAKIASMNSANQSRDQFIDRLLNNAQRYRSLMQDKALQTLGQLEGARQNRNFQFGQKVNSITQPLGQAANAFTMSQLFDDPTQRDVPDLTGVA